MNADLAETVATMGQIIEDHRGQVDSATTTGESGEADGAGGGIGGESGVDR